MYLSFLISALLLLSACSTTPMHLLSTENNTKQTIQSNQSIADHAKDEYQKLQTQRNKEQN
ncbi:hypothetical protein MNB_SV-3-187 [hydrothermal vent metagenome]|uniref:Uncharacterized protein n=1 Tax=hydrothermal vent metagenome TaxID=652676 RepID=A0A1W1BSI3_9ZZZZ